MTATTSIFHNAPTPDDSAKVVGRPLTKPAMQKSNAANRYQIIAQAAVNVKEKAL